MYNLVFHSLYVVEILAALVVFYFSASYLLSGKLTKKRYLFSLKIPFVFALVSLLLWIILPRVLGFLPDNQATNLVPFCAIIVGSAVINLTFFGLDKGKLPQIKRILRVGKYELIHHL